MPQKKGAGGRLQNYDSHGRYTKTDFNSLLKLLSALPKSKNNNVQTSREELYNKARNSRDPLVFDIFLAIESSLPGTITDVNCYRYDEHHHKREFDIFTKSCIIEVKSGQAKDQTKQFFAQKEYAASHKKNYIIYAPHMAYGTKKYLTRQKISVVNTTEELITFLKEIKK